MGILTAAGHPVLSLEERKAQLDEMIKLTTDEGLKELVAVETLQDAQKLWLSGKVTSEQLTAFILSGIALELSSLRVMFASLRASAMPRPGGGLP